MGALRPLTSDGGAGFRLCYAPLCGSLRIGSLLGLLHG